MPNAFDSARRKLNWAKKHLADFQRESSAFNKANKCELFTEPDPKRPETHVVLKMRMTEKLPEGIAEMVGDIVDNLRSALDHAMYGVAIAAKRETIEHAYFPFSGDAAHFESNLKGRCRDVPQEIYPLLRKFQPYKGGNEALWALNLVCIANKHKLVIPCASASQSAGVDIEVTGFGEMPYTPTWDSAKNEMALCTVSRDTQKLDAKFGFAVYIAFGEVDLVGGEPVGPVLEQFADMIETIIAEIEGETRRLGFMADL